MYAMDALLVIGICGGGWLMQRRRDLLKSGDGRR